MTIDDIFQMTKRVSTIKALMALSDEANPKRWHDAWRAAQQDPNVRMAALAWLNDQARKEGGYKDTP